MYAQRGHGKRSGFYSDYTFGVWNAEGDALVPVGKAYFGFTDEELVEIDRFVRNNTTDRFGPVRAVRAEPDHGLVLEVAFEGLHRSTRHRSGVAMRFPRIAPPALGQAAAEADRIERWRRCCRGREPGPPERKPSRRRSTAGARTPPAAGACPGERPSAADPPAWQCHASPPSSSPSPCSWRTWISTVIATSLPAIAADIGTEPIALKLALTAYFVALAIFIPISGLDGRPVRRQERLPRRDRASSCSARSPARSPIRSDASCCRASSRAWAAR